MIQNSDAKWTYHPLAPSLEDLLPWSISSGSPPPAPSLTDLLPYPIPCRPATSSGRCGAMSSGQRYQGGMGRRAPSGAVRVRGSDHGTASAGWRGEGVGRRVREGTRRRAWDRAVLPPWRWWSAAGCRRWGWPAGG
jgi:hypothetical protein